MSKGISPVTIFLIVAIFLIAASIYEGTTGTEFLGAGKSKCTDSDGGKNYKVRGTTRAPAGTRTDECYSDKQLSEFYCPRSDSREAERVVVDCPNGCKDGRCISSVSTCKDSDGGNKIYVKGTTSGYMPLASRSGTWTDICGGVLGVTEYYCDSNEVWWVLTECKLGCKNGACLTGFTNFGLECGDGLKLNLNPSCKTEEQWVELGKQTCASRGGLKSYGVWGICYG